MPMTHQTARRLVDQFGEEAAKRYLREYFANKRLPGDPAERRLEFARFFFADAFDDDSPEFHIELFRLYAEGKNFGAAAPRGHAKTTVSSTELIYRICNAISHMCLVISDTYSQARDIVDNVRGELESNELLVWVYGDLRTNWHWTTGGFTTNNNVRVLARGSNMKVRGLKFRHWRPDFALVDDLENDEAVMNQERRDKLMKWLKMAVMPAMNPKNSLVAIVGTILHNDSLLNNLINGSQGFGGWTRKRWAALNVGEDGQEYSLWPARFPVEMLKRMRDDPQYERYLGPLAFAQEMQNEAIDDAARIIKRVWVYGTEEKPLTYSYTAKEEQWKREHPEDSKTWLQSEIKQILMAVDPAISEDTRADYFAILVIGVDKNGEIWVLDIVRERIPDIDLQVEKIIELAELWNPERIKIEAVAYQAGLSRAVQRAAAKANKHLPIFPVVPDKDKFRRAVVHSANFAGGLVHIRTDHPNSEVFIQEILDFPVGKHDDMFDAFMHAAEQLVQRIKTRVFRNKPQGF